MIDCPYVANRVSRHRVRRRPSPRSAAHGACRYLGFVTPAASKRWTETAPGRLKRKQRADDLSAQRGLITPEPLKDALIPISECFETMREISHRSSERRGSDPLAFSASLIFGVIGTVARIGPGAATLDCFEHVEADCHSR